MTMRYVPEPSLRQVAEMELAELEFQADLNGVELPHKYCDDPIIDAQVKSDFLYAKAIKSLRRSFSVLRGCVVLDDRKVDKGVA